MNYVQEAGGLYGQNLLNGLTFGITALHNWATGCTWHFDSISFAVPFAVFNVAAFVALLPFAFACCRRGFGHRRRRQALVGVFATLSTVAAVMSLTGVCLFINDSLLTDEAEFIKRGGACRDSQSSANLPGSLYITSSVYSLFLLIAASVTCCTKRRPLRFLATEEAPVSIFPKNKKPSKSVLGGLLSLTGLVSVGICTTFLLLDCRDWRLGFTCCLAIGCFFIACGCVALPFSRKDFHSSTSYAPLFVACLTLAAVCHCVSWAGIAVAFFSIGSGGSGGAGLGDSAKMWMGVYHSGNFTLQNYEDVCSGGGMYLAIVSVLLTFVSAAYLIALAVLYYQFVRLPLSDPASVHEDEAEAEGAPEDTEGGEEAAEDQEEGAPPVDTELGARYFGASGFCLTLSGFAGAVTGLIFLCIGCPWQLDGLTGSLVLGLLLVAAGAPACALLRRQNSARFGRLMQASIGLTAGCICLSIVQLTLMALDLFMIEEAARLRRYWSEESVWRPSVVETRPSDDGTCETRSLFLIVFSVGTFGLSVVHLVGASFCYHYFKKQQSLVVTADAAFDEPHEASGGSAAKDEQPRLAKLDSVEAADETEGKKTPANEAEDEPASKKMPANEAEDEPASKKTPANETEDEPASKKMPANEEEDESKSKKTPANETEDEPASKKTPANEEEDESKNKKTPAN